MGTCTRKFSSVLVAAFCLVLCVVSQTGAKAFNRGHRRSKSISSGRTTLCSRELDVAFLMDSSGTVSRRQWKVMKAFVKDIIDRYEVGPNSVHVSVIQFSTNPKVILKFNSLKGAALNADTVKRYIDRAPRSRGLGFIDRALNAADRVVFTEENGMRRTADKVVLLITDGPQTKRFGPYMPLHTLSQSLRSKGVQLYAVGVGRAVDRRELETITGLSKNILLTKTFNKLLRSVDFIGYQLCNLSPKKCRKQVDIAFLIDSSGSVNRMMFSLIKSFVKDIIDRYEISPVSVKVSLISFSTHPTVELKFNSLSGANLNADKIKTLVDQMIHSRGLGFIDRALNAANSVVFTVENGMRPRAAKVGLLITDGPQTKRFGPYMPLDTLSQSLRSKGVQLYAVGVGRAVNRRELETITAVPQNVFLVKKFKSLLTNVEYIGSKLCNELDTKLPKEVEAPPPTLAPTSAPKCSKDLDIAFLVDSSGTVNRKEFRQMKTFIKDFLERFEVSPSSVHVSLITFSTFPRVVLKFNSLRGQALNKEEVERRVDQMRQSRGLGFIYRALSVADTAVFTEKHGMRLTATKVAVLISDGPQTKRFGPFMPLDTLSQSLRSKGVQLYAVGVGQAVDRSELETITAEPQNVFLVKTFNKLPGNADIVGNRLCVSSPQKCSAQVDLAVIMDSSGSIDSKEWITMKSAVKGFIDRFEIGPNSVHVSLLKFSTTPKVILKFNWLSGANLTAEHVRERIEAMRHARGLGFIDRALHAANTELFTEGGGVRPQARKVVLLIMDGPQTKRFGPYMSLHTLSQSLRSKGVRLYAVGVGRAVDSSELETITAEPQNVFLVKTFEEFEKKTKVISSQLCTPSPQKCNKELDLAILMDSTGSISRREYRLMKSFVKNIINQYVIGPESVHVSLVKFSTFPKVVLKFNSLLGANLTEAAVDRHVDGKGHSRGLGFIDRALNAADRVVFTEENGMRPKAAKVVLLITDGPQTKRFGPYMPLHTLSQSLRSKGVQLYAVGVGRAVNRRELETITAVPQNVFLVRSFQKLATHADDIGSKLC